MRIGLLIIWAIAAAFALLCEADVLPTGYIADTPANRYACDSLSTLSALGGAFLLLQRRRFGTTMRLLWAAIAVAPALFVYYAKEFASSAIYGLAIGLTATLAAFVIEGKAGHEKDLADTNARKEKTDKP